MYDLQMYKFKTYGDEKGTERKEKTTPDCSFLSQWSLVIMSPRGTGRTCDRDRDYSRSPQRRKTHQHEIHDWCKHVRHSNLKNSASVCFYFCLCAHTSIAYFCAFACVNVNVCVYKCVSVFKCVNTQ